MILSHFKLQSTTFFRNDTIDCYPLAKGKIRKILIVSGQKFKELQNDFQSFFKGLRDRPATRSSIPGTKNGQILGAPRPSDSFRAKIDPLPYKQSRDYEPSNAIYCNTSDWRRWIRVKEWFSQYAQHDEQPIFQNVLLTQ